MGFFLGGGFAVLFGVGALIATNGEHWNEFITNQVPLASWRPIFSEGFHDAAQLFVAPIFFERWSQGVPKGGTVLVFLGEHGWGFMYGETAENTM